MTTEEIKKVEQATAIKAFSSMVLEENSIDKMRTLCRNGEIGKNHLRPLAWRLFLNVLDEEDSIQDWIKVLENLREEYKIKKKTFFLKKPKRAGDPLTAEANQKDADWKQYYQDKEVRELIDLDLSRTYQELTQFLREDTKKMLGDILFIWYKENQDVSYKQGMNDLLAVIYLAFYPYYYPNSNKRKADDLLSFSDANEFQKNVNDIYLFFNDEGELEADLYWSFANLMKKGMKELYNTDIQNKQMDFKTSNLIRNQWTNDTSNDPQTIINKRCDDIVQKKLKALDPELYQHLNDVQLCMVFLQRYLKCIFNREFEYQEAFLLWDAIFANEEDKSKPSTLSYIDYIALAMVLRVRNELLQGDQNDCLTIFFHYEKPEDVHDLVIIAEKVKSALAQYRPGQLIDVETLISKKIPMFGYQLISKKDVKEDNPLQKNVYEEEQHKKSFFGNALKRVKTLGQKVSEKIDQMKEKKTNEINNIAISNPRDAITIFDEILRKYKGKMNAQDASDFSCAINFFKLNSK